MIYLRIGGCPCKKRWCSSWFFYRVRAKHRWNFRLFGVEISNRSIPW